ncbi:triphosphoribosyl-dephospho-CoA synthase [Streptomyces sp. NPDC096310]|uniref:triphosphoribosyl-dephospho-CoA synthase n=1 Tax=Streptomyces sp. NPDC096310 TaxID=3366082 RepID=UPI0038164B03
MRREDEAPARASADALPAEAELTPEPGLPDTREADFGAPRWSAGSLVPGLAAMAAAARRAPEGPSRRLRAELGWIGRATELSMARANAGSPLHHGALRPLGLLVAAALEPARAPDELPAAARRIVTFTDGAAPRRPAPGSAVASRYGAAGARGEARAGFPHVRRALAALRSARDVLDAGGTATAAGRSEPAAFDTRLRAAGAAAEGQRAAAGGGALRGRAVVARRHAGNAGTDAGAAPATDDDPRGPAR